MASMRDIKRRRESIQQHVTDHQGDEAGFYREIAEGQTEDAEETKPYFDKMYETVSHMLANIGRISAAIRCFGQ